MDFVEQVKINEPARQDPLKPTLTVRLIALALITLGTLSISQLIVEMFRGRFGLDFHVFLVPIGIGLLRRSPNSRRWASFYCGLTTIALTIVLTASALFLIIDKPDSMKNEFGAIGVSGAIVCLVLFSLAWRELKSKKTIEWFESNPSARDSINCKRSDWVEPDSTVLAKRKPFQFRLSTILFCTTLLALVCVVHRSDIIYHPREVQSIATVKPDGSIVNITYGVWRYRGDTSRGTVDFVVVESESDKLNVSVLIKYSSNYPYTEATLTLSSGESFDLPGKSQLHEIKEGVYRAIPGSVSVRQLDAFLNDPGDHTIESLLAKPME